MVVPDYQQTAFVAGDSSSSTGNLPQREATLEGLVEICSTNAKGNCFDLVIRCDLKVSEKKISLTAIPAITNAVGHQHAWHRWRNTSDPIRISRHGEIQTNHYDIELPYGLGDLTQFVVLKIPASVATDQQASLVRFSVDRPIRNNQSNAPLKVVFDARDGVIHSVQTEIVRPFEADGESETVSMWIELTRLTATERDDWNRSTSDQTTTQTAALSQEDAERCVADLSSSQNVMHWLHRLNRCDPDTFPPAVVDAIAATADGENRSYRVLARRIRNRIPDAQLNPFRIVD